MGNETHGNLLHKNILTWIINKLCNKLLFIHASVTLEYFNFKRENEFERFVIYLYCFSDNCCRMTAGEMKWIHIWIVTIICLRTLLISSTFLLQVLNNTISKTLWWPSLACGDLDWLKLTLCKMTVSLGYARLVVTRKPTHWCNLAGSRTLPSLNSIIHYYTLH